MFLFFVLWKSDSETVTSEQLQEQTSSKLKCLFILMEYMTCLERHMGTEKCRMEKSLYSLYLYIKFIIYRTAFLKTLFQSSHLLFRQMEKKLQPKAVATSLHESKIRTQNVLQLACSTPVVSADASSVPSQWMCCCHYFHYNAWERILLSSWWNRLLGVFFIFAGQFPFTYFAIIFPFRWGEKKDVRLSLPPPYHKRTCCWIPPEIICCHSQCIR